MEGFYRKQGGARELTTKEKKKLFWGWDIFSLGEKNCRSLFFLWVAMGPKTLLVLNQKILSWLIMIAFLGEVETTVRSGIESRFDIVSFWHK